MSEVLNAAQLLANVVTARDHLRDSRAAYHHAIMAASRAGCSNVGIARVLGTQPLYIGNTIRQHRNRACPCGAS